jgi:hypothetical protein
VGIFFTHFYADIFFSLHEPSLRSAAKDGTVKPILAIAILTLTARFIPQLVKKHGSAVAACDYYANSIRSDLLLNADKPSLEIIHALLFLSMHDWGSGRGARAVSSSVRFHMVYKLILQSSGSMQVSPSVRRSFCVHFEK